MANLALPCVPWSGTRDKDGYGTITLGPRGDSHMYRVARLTYVEWYGDLPSALQPDHLCGNPSCWEPAHLEAVTPRVNTLRSQNIAAQNARKTHCIRGHEFNAVNTYLARGRRYCRACRRVG